MSKKVGLETRMTMVHKNKIRVRFNEVDSMKIVWHGEYVKYFEDGRESFGNHFGIGYLDIYNAGYSAPLVDLHITYKLPLIYGDTAIVETTYIYNPAAKIHFVYNIFRESDGELVANGYSIQVFLNSEGTLEWTNPDFFLKWQKKWTLKE